jgi:hypothetical protein
VTLILVQNIRNNKTHRRTPKWAQRYGLVNTSKIERDDRRSQWANRYQERLQGSALDGQPYEEGQNPSSLDLSQEGDREDAPQRQTNGKLWNTEEESYYGQGNDANRSQSSGRWHYPANFEDTISPPIEGTKKSSKKKKEKKDRWARTEDAYSYSEERSKKKSKKVKKKTSMASGSMQSGNSSTEFPEDAAGGLYGDHSSQPQADPVQTGDDIFSHQF